MLPQVRHTFSHFHLDIVPALVEVDGSQLHIMDDGHRLWYNRATPPACGLAAPVASLLNQLSQHPALAEP